MSLTRRDLLGSAVALCMEQSHATDASPTSEWFSRDGSVDGAPQSDFQFGTLNGRGQAWASHNCGQAHACRVLPDADPAQTLRLELRSGEQWPDEAKLALHVERTMVEAMAARRSNQPQYLPMSQEIWWSFSFLLEPGPAIQSLGRGYDWLIFADIHSDWASSHARAVPIKFELAPGDIFDVQLHGSVLHPDNSDNIVYRDSAPLRRGTWHDLVLQIVMDPTNAHGDGGANVYLDGERVVTYAGALGFVGDNPYPQLQIYRDNPDIRRLKHETVALRYANHEIVTSGNLLGRVSKAPAMPQGVRQL
ncbi:MAG: heparin lyase I family protein [Rudaea sp.]